MHALLAFRSVVCVPGDRRGHMHQHLLTPDEVANNSLTRSQLAIERGATFISAAIKVDWLAALKVCDWSLPAAQIITLTDCLRPPKDIQWVYTSYEI